MEEMKNKWVPCDNIYMKSIFANNEYEIEQHHHKINQFKNEI